MKNFKGALIVSVLLIIVSVFAGCAGMGNTDMDNQDQTGVPQGYDNNQQDRLVPGQDNMFGQYEQNDVPGRINQNGMNDMNGMNQMSDRIENEVNNMQGIDRADCVVSGDTAIVGCKTNQNIEKVKPMVENKIKQMNPSIKNVVVTNSPDLMEEIRRMSDQTMNGMGANGNMDNRIKQLMNKINAQ